MEKYYNMQVLWLCFYILYAVLTAEVIELPLEMGII